MASHYSVIRYIPDPIAGEQINIGILVVSETGVQCRFLQRWARVRCFGNENLKFLYDFVKDMERACSHQTSTDFSGNSTRMTKEQIESMVVNWCNSIQMTPLRGSLLDSEKLLAKMSTMYLIESPEPPRRFKTKADIARSAETKIRRVLVDSVGDEVAEQLVHPHQRIDGQYSRHNYDVVVRNGHLIATVQAISFQRQESVDLERDVESISWAITDLKAKYDGVAMAVITALPAQEPAIAREARFKYKRMGAQVLAEDEVTDWAESQHFERAIV